MLFLNGVSISLSQIPKYPEFQGEFKEDVDFTLLSLLSECDELKEKCEILASLKTLMENVNNNKITVSHYQAKGCGRFYANNKISLIPLSKFIKHTVFSYLGWSDIDMVKGHPSIAFEVFSKAGIKLPAFEDYISNFDKTCEILKEFYSGDCENPLQKDNIKWLFNMMIYGGGFQSWVEGVEKGDEEYLPKKLQNKGVMHPLVANFKKECELIRDTIYKNKDNKAFIDKVVNKTDELHKKKNTAVSYWFQTIENHIVYIVAVFLIEKKIISKKHFGLEYDGLNLPPLPSDVNKDELINQINDYVYLKTGLKILFKFKDYGDYVLHSVIEKRKTLPSQEETDEDEDDDDKDEEVKRTNLKNSVRNDFEASQKVFSLYPHWVCCKDVLYVFDDETGMWSSNSSIQRLIIGRFSHKLMVVDANMTVSRNKSYGNTLEKINIVLVIIKSLCVNDNWLNEKMNSSLGYLLFTNGYFDGKKGLFYDKKTYGFNPDIVFMNRVPHAFTHFTDEELTYMKNIKQRLFYDTLGIPVGDYFINTLSRGLMGEQL